MTRLLWVLAAAAAAALPAGCGASGPTTVNVPRVAPAQTFSLGAFAPAGRIAARRPTTMSFDIRTPSGRPLAGYKTGSGPHTGVHLIIVRNDLASIIHDHPPIAANGMLHQLVTFPAAGPYHVLVDAYPDVAGEPPNFQLTRTVDVAGAYRPAKLPPFHGDDMIDGYHFHMPGVGGSGPTIHAIQAQFVHVDVTGPDGRPVHFAPWFGALAHAIFFREGSLNYFHTHVCGPDAPNCGSLRGLAASRVSGRAIAPGRSRSACCCRCRAPGVCSCSSSSTGDIITAPFTLHVH